MFFDAKVTKSRFTLLAKHSWTENNSVLPIATSLIRLQDGWCMKLYLPIFSFLYFPLSLLPHHSYHFSLSFHCPFPVFSFPHDHIFILEINFIHPSIFTLLFPPTCHSTSPHLSSRETCWPDGVVKTTVFPMVTVLAPWRQETPAWQLRVHYRGVVMAWIRSMALGDKHLN